MIGTHEIKRPKIAIARWPRKSIAAKLRLARARSGCKAQGSRKPVNNVVADSERVTLAEIAHRLGRKALQAVANAAKPDTLMGWYRRLVARKFDGSKSRRYPGRPRIDDEIEQWVVRIAKENSDWGYDRIVGAMANLGYTLSDQTVGNILQRHGIPPVPERKRTTTWSDFIHAHLSVLAGTDFFTVEVLTLRGLVTY